MAFQSKPNSWSLFKNDRKENDRHPDYKGQGNLAGVEVWLSAWVRETKDGKKYFSGTFTPKEQQGRAGTSALPPKQNRNDDDDIPF